MSNDSALYVTGSCAFSSSLYVSWGAATGSATTVGIRQNDIGTLEFKDNATGSWTEFGNSRDLTSVRNAHLVLIDDDVAHGITNVAQTDAYGDFGPIHSTRGGLMINGMSDQESAAARSLALRGISNDTHTDTVATVEIIGAKRSGTTVQALASAETVLEVANHTTALVTVLGDGAVGIGVVDPDSPLEILDTSTQQKWSYDSDSFATIAVAASSNTTIATGESGNLTLDSAGDITLDADGADVYFKDAGVQQGVLKMDTANKFILSSSVSVNDVYVMSGRDIVLDASAADISLQDDATQYLKFTNSSGDCIVYNGAADKDIIFKDLGGNTIVTIDGGDEAIIVADDKKIYFGDNKESSIEYDEDGTNRLIISGSAQGIQVAGKMFLSGNTPGQAALYISGSGPYGASGQATVIIDEDKDASIIVGEAHMGNGGSTGLAYFSHKDSIGANNAAIIQFANGSSYLNSKSGQALKLSVNAGTKVWIDSSGNVGIGASHDPTFLLDVSGSTRFGMDHADTHHFSGSLDVSGSVLPSSDNVHNLGSSGKRWANLYTADLHLKNNKGDWTILEEEDYLCVVNNKTKKRYKMMLEEIED